MKQILWVGIGGFLGAVARFKLGAFVLQQVPNWKFPIGTFVVNVLGCLIAGLLAGLVAKHEFFSADTRLFLFVGVLGGFTTFSAFGLETVYLLQKNEIFFAAVNIVASVTAGILFLWIGMKVTSA